MQNFYIFSMLYGQHYVDLFRRAAFRSLNWPKNKAALGEARTWVIYTKRQHFQEFEEMFKGSSFKLELLELGDGMQVAGITAPVPTIKCEQSIIMLNGFRAQVLRCLQTKQKLLLAPPDTVFGDGSIESILRLDDSLDSCVFVSHMRVLPKVLDHIEYSAATEGALTNQQLCKVSLENAHASWEMAKSDHRYNNSFVGGICWREISPGLISVQHRLPTPYLLGFNPHDWDFWWGTVGFGAIDHSWPGDRLYRQERARYIGSSDAAFICEITDHDKNVPQSVERNSNVPPDAYWGDRIHHSINRIFNVIWRY